MIGGSSQTRQKGDYWMAEAAAKTVGTLRKIMGGRQQRRDWLVHCGRLWGVGDSSERLVRCGRLLSEVTGVGTLRKIMGGRRRRRVWLVHCGGLLCG